MRCQHTTRRKAAVGTAAAEWAAQVRKFHRSKLSSLVNFAFVSHLEFSHVLRSFQNRWKRFGLFESNFIKNFRIKFWHILANLTNFDEISSEVRSSSYHSCSFRKRVGARARVSMADPKPGIRRSLGRKSLQKETCCHSAVPARSLSRGRAPTNVYEIEHAKKLQENAAYAA